MSDLYGLPVIYHPAAPAVGCLYVPPMPAGPWSGLLTAADRDWYQRIGPAASATGAIVARDRATLDRAIRMMQTQRRFWTYYAT